MKITAKELLVLLLDATNQACQVDVSKNGKKIYCNDMALSTFEDIFEVLAEEGYAKKIMRGKRKGLWQLKFIALPKNK